MPTGRGPVAAPARSLRCSCLSALGHHPAESQLLRHLEPRHQHLLPAGWRAGSRLRRRLLLLRWRPPGQCWPGGVVLHVRGKQQARRSAWRGHTSMGRSVQMWDGPAPAHLMHVTPPTMHAGACLGGRPSTPLLAWPRAAAAAPLATSATRSRAELAVGPGGAGPAQPAASSRQAGQRPACCQPLAAAWQFVSSSRLVRLGPHAHLWWLSPLPPPAPTLPCILPRMHVAQRWPPHPFLHLSTARSPHFVSTRRTPCLWAPRACLSPATTSTANVPPHSQPTTRKPARMPPLLGACPTHQCLPPSVSHDPPRATARVMHTEFQQPLQAASQPCQPGVRTWPLRMAAARACGAAAAAASI